MLEEMKESRFQEIAPYVTVYFDVPYGKQWIYLVVKNSGKTIAKDVKLEFSPKLTNSDGLTINEIPLIKDGIALIPPEYEIKTFFDTGASYFKDEKFPLSYNVKIEYSTDNGATWFSPAIVDNTPNSGSYPWLIPNTPSTNCLVKISDANDGDPSDVSDNVFSIVIPAIKPFIISSGFS